MSFSLSTQWIVCELERPCPSGHRYEGVLSTHSSTIQVEVGTLVQRDNGKALGALNTVSGDAVWNNSVVSDEFRYPIVEFTLSH